MQFQTENVLNTIDNVKSAAQIGLTAGSGFILRNGMLYNSANIVGQKVTKTAHSAGALEKWEIDMPAYSYYAGKTFRLLVDVRLKGDIRSDYERWSVYKGKPFYVEFSVTDAATTTSMALAEIVETIKAGIDKNGYKDLTITKSGGVGVQGTYTGTPTGASTAVTITADNEGTAGNITLTANSVKSISLLITEWNAAHPTNTVKLISGNGAQVPTANIVLATGAAPADNGKLIIEGTLYSQVFDAVILQEAVDNTTSTYSADIDFETLQVGTKVTSAAEPFGSAWFITKNLRMPTSSNTRFMAVGEDERPIDGANYDQYTFTYQVSRDIHGMSAVGQMVTSETQHIIYVKTDLASAFETILTSGATLTVA